MSPRSYSPPISSRTALLPSPNFHDNFIVPRTPMESFMGFKWPQYDEKGHDDYHHDDQYYDNLIDSLATHEELEQELPMQTPEMETYNMDVSDNESEPEEIDYLEMLFRDGLPYPELLEPTLREIYDGINVPLNDRLLSRASSESSEEDDQETADSTPPRNSIKEVDIPDHSIKSAIGGPKRVQPPSNQAQHTGGPYWAPAVDLVANHLKRKFKAEDEEEDEEEDDEEEKDDEEEEDEYKGIKEEPVSAYIFDSRLVLDPVTLRPRKRLLIDSDPKYNSREMIKERHGWMIKREDDSGVDMSYDGEIDSV